ncbi:electron transfer flavoprotein subunit alpha/FixB family protein [bacterium]|nr:electron transfer flavoprotein subunit alpha/FixB family protein [bacterium]
MMADILVLAESAEGKVKKTSLELVSKAHELAQGGTVSAILLGSGTAALASQLAPYGATKVYAVESASLDKYNTIAFTKVLTEAVGKINPKIVLGTSSAVGKDLFPRLAARLKAGLSTDSTDLKVEGGNLVARKPVYSGKASVEIAFNSPIQLATTRPNSFPTKVVSEGATATAEVLALDAGELRAVMKEQVQGAVGKTDLTEAEIIVSGGRAMGNADNFKILQDMAAVIGATVGASRAAVDSGFAPHDMQVGQTGKVVNPKLYMACGISGAIQHLAGMRTSKVIVAINKDPEAPIFGKADYGIVGDLFTLVPLLTEEFKKAVAE